MIFLNGGVLQRPLRQFGFTSRCVGVNPLEQIVKIAALGNILVVGFLSPFHHVTHCFTLRDEVISK